MAISANSLGTPRLDTFPDTLRSPFDRSVRKPEGKREKATVSLTVAFWMLDEAFRDAPNAGYRRAHHAVRSAAQICEAAFIRRDLHGQIGRRTGGQAPVLWRQRRLGHAAGSGNSRSSSLKNRRAQGSCGCGICFASCSNPAVP